MNISSSFNRFYHSAVLTELYKKCGTLKFKFWIDRDTGATLEFVKGEHFSDVDELKQLLKNMNLEYSVCEDKKTSTRDIDSKSLMHHIEFVIAVASENNVTFNFIEDEWRRMLNNAGIERWTKN